MFVARCVLPSFMCAGANNAPMKRPAQPAELAPAYVYLASEDSSFTTGEILAVTGGGITA